MSVYRISVFLLLVVSATTGLADNQGEDVRVWLQRMVNAVHSLSYEGTFVFLHNDQLESMRIVHTADQAGEKERLISLNGVAREVFRDNASVTCIAPDVKSISIGKRVTGEGFRAIFSVDISQLENLYDFHLLGQERVAGRPARVVAIMPRDNYRYGYRVYLDIENALPLKTDMLDVSGKAVSQLMFTQLQVHSSSRDISDISLDGKEHYDWVQQKPRQAVTSSSATPWSFSDLPKGFAITLHSKRNADQSDGSIDHFVLSDGLASLSVYIEEALDEGLRGSSAMGTINAFGSETGGFSVTAVGEVPAVTVERIARSIRINEQ
ncbi:MAG: MucB/RseB C-terminal domain-containing protein [Sedimenticola sp.]|nr:MucB/RseB C-terminal domain-containing protein [Sedimenticola sp.]